MKATLTIDDDVLAAAKVLAAQQATSVSRVISELARKGLRSMSPRNQASFQCSL